MTKLTKAEAIAVIRRTRGPDVVAVLAEQLPDTLDLDDAKDQNLLYRLGLSREVLINHLGGEI
ncbi:MAG TPA: hypothetical protein VGH43_04160 [Jatrophihabitans sp.]|jgi:hypothetical protein